MNRIGVKVFCLLVALVLWLQVAATTVVDGTLALPLEVIGLPDGATIAGNELPAAVRVRVRDSKLRLLAHRYLGRGAGSVTIDLSREQPGAIVQRDISPADARTDLTVMAVTPPVHLRLQVDRLETRVLPVRVVMGGELPEGRVLLRPPVTFPAVVAVRGPERLLRDLTDVPTEPVELGRLRSNAGLTRRLEPPRPGLALDVREVKVEVAVATRETRTFTNVPVVPLVDASQPPATVFPPAATLSVSGPADSLRALVTARVTVTVSLSGLGAGTHHVRGQAILPDGYQLESLQPEQFVVRLGAPERAAGDGP